MKSPMATIEAMYATLVDHVDRYLSGRYSLHDLEKWLVSNLQSILNSNDAKAIHLANQVDADLMELSEGLLDEVTVRRRIEAYIYQERSAMPTTLEEAQINLVAFHPADDMNCEVDVRGFWGTLFETKEPEQIENLPTEAHQRFSVSFQVVAQG